MILTVHAAKGTLLGILLPPGVAQIAGFFSHFFADALPHWELDRAIKNRRWLKIAAGVDLGAAFLAYAVIMSHLGLVVWSLHIFSTAAIACLPDLIEFIKKAAQKPTLFTSSRPTLLVVYCHDMAHSFWQKKKDEIQQIGFQWQAAVIFLVVFIL